VTVYFDKIINRFEDSQAVESATGRLEQFKSAWPLIDKRLVTGIGPGVSTLFSRWNPDRKHIQKALSGKAMPNAIHCAQLQVLVERTLLCQVCRASSIIVGHKTLTIHWLCSI
jgi:O-antigen ligase